MLSESDLQDVWILWIQNNSVKMKRLIFQVMVIVIVLEMGIKLQTPFQERNLKSNFCDILIKLEPFFFWQK